jgi:hypothetical protein
MMLDTSIPEIITYIILKISVFVVLLLLLWTFTAIPVF